MTGPIRLLVADDQPIARLGIKTILEAEKDFILVGEAADGEEAQRLSLARQPDVLLLDLNMPGPSTGETVAYLRRRSPGLKILVLVARIEDIGAYSPSPAEVTGYVLKAEAPEAMIAAIRTVIEGGAWFSQGIVQRLLQEQKREPAEAQKPLLTERELAVLQLVAAGQTDKEIAQALNMAERTVRYGLRQVCDKLGVNSRLETVAQAIRLGLVE